MSYRYTLGDARTACATAVNLCPEDASGRLDNYINRGCETLHYGDAKTGSGKWQGTYGKYRLCVSNTSCLTWLREIETIEAFALDKIPREIRNEWYEFLEMGPGLQDECCGSAYCSGRQLIDDGESPCFDDVIYNGNNKKLAVYCDVTETTTDPIILRFYRGDSKEKCRTELGSPGSGNWVEGEYLTLPAAGNYQLTTNTVMPGGVYAVIKPVTKGVIRLYEYDTVDLTYRRLGYYEPSETKPVYRRSRVPGLKYLATSDGSTCERHTITVIGKFRFIPASDKNDFIQIPHLDAVRLACQAILREESGKLEEAVPFWSMAFARLNAQLAHYRGHGESIPIRFVGRETFGGGIRMLR